jgi:hypothetical protein
VPATSTSAAASGEQVAWCSPTIFTRPHEATVALEGGDWFVQRAGRVLGRDLR